tara:strand:- start:245 stop:775 length:531 start_codon:yes stop_codon:yes gene_type:complete
MESPIDLEDFDFEIFENDTPIISLKLERRCPQCNVIVTGRPNKKFCTPNCRKRHSEPTRNSYHSPTKRRENTEFFERAMGLAVELYSRHPEQRYNYIKDLIDLARLGEDRQLQDILSNQRLIYINPINDRHLLHRNSPEYFTIAQIASNCCKRYWKANVNLVVYNKVDYPADGVVE